MKYTEEQTAFLIKHGAMSRNELTGLFNTQFGTNQSDKAIKTRCTLLGLKCASSGRFQKGCTPMNKGTKGLMKANITTFKVGDVPRNKKSVGCITKRKDKNGYSYQLIKIAEPNRWQMLHAYIWEHKHGAIPKGHCVIFKDKNPDNVSLSNLMLVSRNELARLNQKYPYVDASLKEVALQVVKLQTEIIKKNKKNQPSE